MAIHSTEISVKARHAELPGLLAELSVQAVALGMSDIEIRRLHLVLEELFTNSVRHGHGGDCDELIEVRLNRGEAGIHLHYRDNARFFDPTAERPSAPPEIGGLGLPLIRGFCRAISYRRQDGGNIIELDLNPGAQGK